ncbi:RNA polymerase sigma-70 factor, ECF subfamily [Paraburkholderia steynii]|uniref:RNA polymerase sigma factor n=1 Tax=Paraburkholderia steynii TaxID=1245441 RepID=A0A7Z7BLJ4_9BURK|nr:RNA polymerase sigma factor [Paraburkholderia steynii]SDJ52309.1 RNA polymerase sigma-70 factor, ECF subfamily [Paraburkholderia steynii]
MNETGKHAGGDARAEAARSLRFQQMALPHLDAAYNLARWLCGNGHDADDVVQEAFMRAYRFFDTFHGETARPWLLAIVRRTWYTEWRRRSGGVNATIEFDENLDDETFEGWSANSPDPEALLIRDENTRLVHEALEMLPVEYREVLILRELEELSYREIATIADLPVGTVMSRLARGRRKLATALTTLQSKGSARPRGGARDGSAAQRGPDGADDVPGARPAMRASARTEGPSRPGHAGGGAPPGGSPDTPRKTESGWMPHAPSALPGGLAQEAPDGL